MLSTDGTDPKTRPAAKFFLDRDLEPNLVTRDLGRVFLGRNLQCAQCHDHPLVDDYKQARLLRHPGVPEPLVPVPERRRPPTAVIAEKADGESPS